MERLHMNHLKDILHRLRSGESERRIARDLQISRPTVHKYYELANDEPFLFDPLAFTVTSSYEDLGAILACSKKQF